VFCLGGKDENVGVIGIGVEKDFELAEERCGEEIVGLTASDSEELLT
jgi:hypothetical protein